MNLFCKCKGFFVKMVSIYILATRQLHYKTCVCPVPGVRSSEAQLYVDREQVPDVVFFSSKNLLTSSGLRSI